MTDEEVLAQIPYDRLPKRWYFEVSKQAGVYIVRLFSRGGWSRGCKGAFTKAEIVPAMHSLLDNAAVDGAPGSLIGRFPRKNCK